MRADCEIHLPSTLLASTLGALMARRSTAMQTVVLEPDCAGLRLRVVSPYWEAESAVAAEGCWTRRVALSARVLLKLARSYEPAPITMIYCAGRLSVNRTSLAVCELATRRAQAPAQPLRPKQLELPLLTSALPHVSSRQKRRRP